MTPTFANRPAGNRGHRRADRFPVLLPASVVTMSAYQFPEVVDLSPAGARLRGATLPPKGSTALLRVGELEVLCRVVWVGEEDCGVRFNETVPPPAFQKAQLQGTAALELVEPANG